MRRIVIATAVALCLAAPRAALATFHLMKVVQVFPGAAAQPMAAYVVIEMYAAGQSLVSGHTIDVYDAAGNLIQQYTFPANVVNSANQTKILIATAEAQTFFGVNADLTMTASTPPLPLVGGKVCFSGTIDCVAWGSWTGGVTGVGNPALPSTGLVLGEALVRDLKGNATLEALDDTDDSATDFKPGTPDPVNNAGTHGTIPSSTCGNGALEGLEQCDDGAANGPPPAACSSQCTLNPPPAADGGTVADAGSGVDAGPVADAGTGADAGTSVDAGTGNDAGADAGTTLDAGSGGDAGSGTDAGPLADAGPGTDAGSKTDAGGTAPDGGGADGGSASSTPPGGCGCGLATAPMLGLIGLLALRRRR
jgi:cysteine-rich repeat protein